MTPHRREETEHRVDRLGSAKHRFGDRLSKVAKRIHGAKNKVRSDAIHGIKAASCGKGIPFLSWADSRRSHGAWRKAPCEKRAVPLGLRAIFQGEAPRRVKGTGKKKGSDDGNRRNASNGPGTVSRDLPGLPGLQWPGLCRGNAWNRRRWHRLFVYG